MLVIMNMMNIIHHDKALLPSSAMCKPKLRVIWSLVGALGDGDKIVTTCILISFEELLFKTKVTKGSRRSPQGSKIVTLYQS